MSEYDRLLRMSPEDEIQAIEMEQREKADLQARLRDGNSILHKLNELVHEVKGMRGELAAIGSALDKLAPAASNSNTST